MPHKITVLFSVHVPRYSIAIRWLPCLRCLYCYTADARRGDFIVICKSPQSKNKFTSRSRKYPSTSDIRLFDEDIWIGKNLLNRKDDNCVRGNDFYQRRRTKRACPSSKSNSADSYLLSLQLTRLYFLLAARRCPENRTDGRQKKRPPTYVEKKDIWSVVRSDAYCIVFIFQDRAWLLILLGRAPVPTPKRANIAITRAWYEWLEWFLCTDETREGSKGLANIEILDYTRKLAKDVRSNEKPRFIVL